MPVTADTIYIVDDRGGLFRVNPFTLQAFFIGSTGVAMTDVAVAPDGTIYGISFNALYVLDPDTAAARLVGSLSTSDNNAFVIDASGRALVATGTLFGGGSLRDLNLATGSTTLIRNLPNGSEGDLVFSGGRLFLAATNNGFLEIDPVSGAAVGFGSHGVNGTFGLARVSGLTFSFADRQVFEANLLTGAVTDRGGYPISFIGAINGAAAFDFGQSGRAAIGSVGGDTLIGAALDDVLSGLAGGDFLLGGGGRDILYGGAGVDLLGGEDGNDTLNAGGDADSVYGGLGSDVALGEGGDDLIYGGGADLNSAFNDGGDFILGGAGADRLFGEGGSDLLGGEDGDDTLTGGLGDDNIYGGAGRDTLIGEFGADLLVGGDGDDVLIAGQGADHLNGGGGSDRFVIFGGDSVGGAADRIQDYAPGFDRIDLSFIDANSGVAGDQAFVFRGVQNGPGGAGTMHVGFIPGVGIFLFGYTDGDGNADVIIDIGTFGVQAGDLIL